MKLIDKCPHCNGTEGVYMLNDYKHVPWKMGFDGSEQDNGDMYDQAYVTGGKNIYCLECDKLICRTSTFDKHLRQLAEQEEIE